MFEDEASEDEMFNNNYDWTLNIEAWEVVIWTVVLQINQSYGNLMSKVCPIKKIIFSLDFFPVKTL